MAQCTSHQASDSVSRLWPNFEGESLQTESAKALSSSAAGSRRSVGTGRVNWRVLDVVRSGVWGLTLAHLRKGSNQSISFQKNTLKPRSRRRGKGLEQKDSEMVLFALIKMYLNNQPSVDVDAIERGNVKNGKIQRKKIQKLL